MANHNPLCLPLLVQCLATLLPGAEAGIAQDERGVTVTLPSGTVRVEVDRERQFRVLAGPQAGLKAPASYVVTAAPVATPFSVAQRDGAVELATAAVRARIDLASGAVSFRDVGGALLLAEQGRRFSDSPAHLEAGSGLLQVEQTFATQADESLYGLGQQQDGLWDWRGLPVYLTQHNTVIAVPMLVSSKGYGVLWDNASKATVNPLDQRVELTLEGAVVEDAGAPKATEDLAKAKKKSSGPAVRRGSFTAGAAGEYVFAAIDGDRRDAFVITVDGTKIAAQRNMWVPNTITGTAMLQAGQKVSVSLLGGGSEAKLYAGLRDRSHTVFRSTVGQVIDYRFFYGPDLNQVVAGYRTATGAAPLWPRWAFGFWQCRERYSSQQEWVDIVARFRSEGRPVDLLVQDWQYWGKYGWGAYQWDETHYPDPKSAIDQLHAMHARLMVSVWPNPQGKARDAIAAVPKAFIGPYYDAYNPAARAVRWAVLKERMYDLGVDAWWQDAAEPGDAGTDIEGKPTAIGPGSQHRLAYPLFHSQGVYEGQRAASPAKRVVNLTRSAYPGMQRYGAAAWSGDIGGNWETLRRQIPAGLNYVITGLPYWTTDSGGFFRPGKQYTDEGFNELQSRWFQYSAFTPILRIHGYQTRTEPWEWLPATQAVMKTYTGLRYRLLPYHYSVGAAVTFQGATPMRPLVMDFPGDVTARAISDQFLYGPAFLVSPVTTAKAVERQVYLPAGSAWIDFWSGASLAGGTTVTTAAPADRLPLHVRAGSIVPFGPPVQYADEQPDAPLELRVYPGADGRFTLYDDAGDGYAYESGERASIELTWNDARRTLGFGARQGAYPGMPARRVFRLVLVGPDAGVGTQGAAGTVEVAYDGTAVERRL